MYSSGSSQKNGSLQSGWVNETRSWSEGKRTGGRPSPTYTHASSPTYSRSPTYSSGKSTSTAASLSPAAQSSRFADSSPVQRPARTPPPAPLQQQSPQSYSSLGTSASLKSGYAYQTFPSRVDGSGNSMADTSCSVPALQKSSLRKKATRTKASGEFAQQRKELDDLMDSVLRLQDEGRFSEAAPYMKRIEVLQKAIEGGYEQEYIEKTGSKPTAPLVRAPERRARVPAKAIVREPTPKDAASGRPASSDPKPPQAACVEAVPVPAAVPASPVIVAPAPVVAAGQAIVAGKDSLSEEDYNSDPDTSDGEEEMGSVFSSPSSAEEATDGKSGFFQKIFKSSSVEEKPVQTQTQPQQQNRSNVPLKERRLSLTGRHTSDCLLLLGPEEEEEIIRTLRGEMAGSAPTSTTSQKSTNSAGSGGVFVPRQAKNPPGKTASSPQRERYHISKEGEIFKAPPENKRFAFWHTRYFFLAGPLLSYRKKKNSNTSRILSLKGATVEAAQVDSKKRGKPVTSYEVRLKTPESERVYRLRLKTKRLAYEWYVAIFNNIKVADREMDATKADKRRKEKAKTTTSPSYLPPPENHTGEEMAMKPGAELKEDINAHYKALDVSATAPASTIKKKYYELSRLYHPDKQISQESTERFAQIAQAYEVLSDVEARQSYDLCERIKKSLRQGIIARIHDDHGHSREVVFFLDTKFEILFWQDTRFGPVLDASHRYVYMRFVQEVLAGSAGFSECPPGLADHFLSLQGFRLGCTIKGAKPLNEGDKQHEGEKYSINIQMTTKQARDDFLDGIRILRCRKSELFKQRLAEIKESGLR